MSKEVPKKENKPELVDKLLGVGLDCGTMWILSARRTKKGINTKRIRDLFLDLPMRAMKMLKLSNTDFIKRDNDILLLGSPALETANVFGKEARRPLSDGLISPTEIDSLEVLSLLVKHVLGKPKVKDEYCYFSIPANPIDKPEKDVIYHKGIFEKIITNLGFKAVASNEAMAVVYAETAKENFSGIGMSFGAGLTNVALSVNTIEGLSFSVARSGDWIDHNAANSIGSTQARMCALKEKGMNLTNPTSREEEAVTFYYRAMIEYVLNKITLKFKSIQHQFALPKPIPIILSGGTSLVSGFEGFFKKVFEEKRSTFPVEISEIRHASDPLTSVASGLLIQAVQEYAE